MSDSSTSPDDREFEEIYKALRAGLLIVACGGGHFRPLQSFCFSLKGAAIRLGTDAVYFDWNSSRETWEQQGGIQHFSEFIRRHASHGVRLFLIDGSPQSGSTEQRLANLLRSPMMLGTIDQDIADPINQLALAENVTVIVTAIAEVVAQEHTNQLVQDLEATIDRKREALNTMRAGIQEIERQFALPDAEAAIVNLPNDVAQQLCDVRASLPRMSLVKEKCAAEIADLIQRKKELKRKKSTPKLIMSIKTSLYSGSWKGILLEQYRALDDWYSATVADGVEVKRHGPLYLAWECPQPPRTRPQPEAVVALEKSSEEVIAKDRPRSWLRRLFGGLRPRHLPSPPGANR